MVRSLVHRSPTGAWMFVSCTVFVLSGRGLCDRPIPRPEESYRGLDVCLVQYLCCQVEVSAMVRSPVQRSPIGAWMFVLYSVCIVRYRSLRRADPSSRGVLSVHGCLSCTVFVLSCRGLCDGPIPHPE
jgi:hypothetical protein